MYGVMRATRRERTRWAVALVSLLVTSGVALWGLHQAGAGRHIAHIGRLTALRVC
jgi:hypothetical protein